MSEKEALAGLRMLAVIARADGSVSSAERAVLAQAMDGAALEGSVTSTGLLEGEWDLEALAAEIASPEGRDAAFSSCFAMAYASRGCPPAEQALLDRISKAWSVPRERRPLLQRFLAGARDMAWFTRVEPTADPLRRDAEVGRDIARYSALAAVLGLNPFPALSAATDVAVVGVQAKMLGAIGRRWGRETPRDTAMQVVAGIGAGSALRLAVRGIASLVPGAGIVFAASTNFAATWALGQVAHQYWESGGNADLRMVGEMLATSRAGGRRVHEKHRAEVETERKDREPALAQLRADYGAGRIRKGDYQRRLAQLR